MAYSKYKHLTNTTESDRVLRDKAFKIASNAKYDGYERRLASMVYIYLCKINNFQMNFINQLLEHLEEEQFILHLKASFGELILLICN